ncbi:MAG: hypothetical protein K8R87_01425 [Verrucomicrobia bacterium]|nr:hypothetical protein [Verrucomicrobiota bacterium]
MKSDSHIPRNNAEVMENIMVLDALGETTPEQKLRLKEAMAKDAALAARHAALTRQTRAMEGIFNSHPSAGAADREAAPLPANVLARMEGIRREALANLRNQQDTPANVVAFPRTIQNSKFKIQNYLAPGLAKAAIIALLGIVTGY